MLIDLSFMDLNPIGAALILVRPTGVTYRSQGGGTSCRRVEVEGCYVPLPGIDLSEDSNIVALQDLAKFHYGKVWELGAVAAACSRHRIPFAATEDREKMEASCEAWVWGRIVIPPGYHGIVPVEAHGAEAVLVWDNSD